MTWFDPDTGAPTSFIHPPQKRSFLFPVMTIALGLSGLLIAYSVLSTTTAPAVTSSPIPQNSIPHQLTAESGQSTQLAQNETIIGSLATQITMAESPTPTQPLPTHTPRALLALPTCYEGKVAEDDLCLIPKIPQTEVPKHPTPTALPCSLTTPSPFNDRVCRFDLLASPIDAIGQGGSDD